MTEVINNIIKHSSQTGSKILIYDKEKGYIDLKLQNGLFCVIQLQNPNEAKVRIASMGGFVALINVSHINELLERLSN